MDDRINEIGEVDAAAPGGSIVAEIAREIVRIHARYYGRGPTKAKAVWRGDIVVVVLEEIFTQGEVVLTEAGHFEQVRLNRQAFQDQVEPLFRQAVEQTTGRPVRAFLSQVSREGVASEVFVLEGAEGAPGSDR
jgi:uncharacterized protein YbcI